MVRVRLQDHCKDVHSSSSNRAHWVLVIVDRPGSSVENKIVFSGNASSHGEPSDEGNSDKGSHNDSGDEGEDEVIPDESSEGSEDAATETTCVAITFPHSLLTVFGLRDIYILDSLRAGHDITLQRSVMAFMQKKAIATGQLTFKVQKVEVYDNVKVSCI